MTEEVLAIIISITAIAISIASIVISNAATKIMKNNKRNNEKSKI